MFRVVIAGCLLTLATFSARSENSAPPTNQQFQITCPGRATMTVTRADYGLTTVMWPGDHFQIAAGHQRSRTDNGDRVAITLFRNGDQMIVNKSEEETWFSYNGKHTVVPCSRSSARENSAVTLERTDAAGKVES